MTVMPRNEDGEMELVLGNKQLLSVLFILVVLLGVFFTMGYVVGRNNPSDEKLRLAVAKNQFAVAGKLPPLTVDPTSGTVSRKPSPALVETPAPVQPVTIEPVGKEPEKPCLGHPIPDRPENAEQALHARMMPGLACWKLSAPVNAASAKPRSGSGVERKWSVISRSLLLRLGS